MQKHNHLKFQWEKFGEVVWLAWWDGSRYGPGYDSRSLKVSQSQKGRDMTWRVEAKPNPARRRKKMFVQSLECHWNDGTQSRGLVATFSGDSVSSRFDISQVWQTLASSEPRKMAGDDGTRVTMLSLGCCCHYAIQMAKDHSFLWGKLPTLRAIPC